MKNLVLKTPDNIKISINHYSNPQRDAVIIICPGCFVSKDARAFINLAEDFFTQLDVISLDFRGHGKSSGLFTFTSKEPDDLKTVVDYAKQKYKKIIMIGFSLGAASSIIYTAKYKDIDGLISVSPPVSFNKIENHFYKKECFIPSLKKFELGKSHFVKPGNIFSKKVNPIDVIKDVSPIPILFMAGTKDAVIYLWHTEKLYNDALEPKQFEIFEKGTHAEDLYCDYNTKFTKTSFDWISKIISS